MDGAIVIKRELFLGVIVVVVVWSHSDDTMGIIWHGSL